MEECKDWEEMLEWLLVYILEDDLFRWVLLEKYSVGVMVVVMDLRREGVIKWLVELGYLVDLVRKIYDVNGGDEGKVVCVL